MMIKITHFQKTDPGLVRENNEDFLGLREWAGSFLFMMADGLGGLDQGEVASRKAVEEMKRIFEAPIFLTNPNKLFMEYFQAVNEKIIDLNENILPRKMATTLTVSFFYEDRLWIGHVGDCRVYRIRKGEVRCLTRDHSSSRNVLTRVIGSDPAMKPDIYEEAVEPLDVYIQCSDGFYTMVNEKEMAAGATDLSPEKCCEKLTILANERGGPDNISLQVIRIDPADF